MHGRQAQKAVGAAFWQKKLPQVVVAQIEDIYEFMYQELVELLKGEFNWLD